MKTYPIQSVVSPPARYSQELQHRRLAKGSQAPSREEIYLRPIAVIEPEAPHGTSGSDVYEKGRIVDIYA